MTLLRHFQLIFILLGVSCVNPELSDPKRVVDNYILALFNSDYKKMRFYSTGESENLKFDWMFEAISKASKYERRRSDYNWVITDAILNENTGFVKVKLSGPDYDAIAEKMLEYLAIGEYEGKVKKLAKTDEEAADLARKNQATKPILYSLNVKLIKSSVGWIVDTNNAELIKIFFPNYKP